MRVTGAPRASNARVIVVMNSFERATLLGLALPSVRGALEALKVPSLVVIFDAGSQDGSIELARSAAADGGSVPVALLEAGPGEEASFAAGCNAAAAWGAAAAPDADHLLFFETDNLLDDPEPLRRALELLGARPELGAVGFTVRRVDGTPAAFGCSPPGAVGFLLGQRAAAWLGLDAPALGPWQALGDARWALAPILYTSPLLVRLAAWRATGGMDAAAFPFTDSDLDWCLRASGAGWRLAVLEAERVIHDNRELASSWSRRRVVHFHRSRLRLLRKHGIPGARLLPPLRWTRHLLELAVLGGLHALGRAHPGAIEVRRELLTDALRGYRKLP